MTTIFSGGRLPLALVLLAAGAPAATVLRVGRGQPLATIAQALAQARTGDLVLVEPGPQPPFEVDGQAVAILCASPPPAAVVVTAGASGPGVAVRRIPAGQSCTIGGVTVIQAGGAAPAIQVAWCPGAVRLRDVRVELPADLPGARFMGVLEAGECGSLWLSRLRVWAEPGRKGSSLVPAPVVGAANQGLSALALLRCDALLEDVEARGFDGDGPAVAGGDGLRLVGECRVSLHNLAAPQGGVLTGGDGPGLGGNAIHLLDPEPADRVQACGRFRLQPGFGGAAPGGYYAFNNDSGRKVVGGNLEERLPAVCVDLTVGRVVASSWTPALGGALDVAVTSLHPRAYALLLGARGEIRDRLSSSFLQGRALLDPAGPGVLVVAAGALAGKAEHRLLLPPEPVLAGLQLTLQALLGPVAPHLAGPFVAFSLPEMVVLT